MLELAERDPLERARAGLDQAGVSLELSNDTRVPKARLGGDERTA